MTHMDEFGSLLSRLLQKATMIVHARAALLALMRPDGSDLHARVALGIDDEQVDGIDRDRLRQFSQLALTAGMPTLLNSSVECTNALGELMGDRFANCLCVPLLAHSPRVQEKDGVEPIAGLLFLFNKARGLAFSPEDSHLATLLGRQIAAVLFEQHRREGIL